LAAPPAGSDKAPRSGKSSDATPKKDRPCFHFKKHGSCKFGMYVKDDIGVMGL